MLSILAHASTIIIIICTIIMDIFTNITMVLQDRHVAIFHHHLILAALILMNLLLVNQVLQNQQIPILAQLEQKLKRLTSHPHKDIKN